jgi:hypothetical protein
LSAVLREDDIHQLEGTTFCRRQTDGVFQCSK